jgi:ribonuclease-3
MYRVLAAVGPDHDKLFRIEVVVDGRVMGRGEGSSRRIAETAAAAVALDRLRVEWRTGRAEPTPSTDAVTGRRDSNRASA